METVPVPVPVPVPVDLNEIRKLEMAHELVRVGLLIGGAAVFAHFGQMELASSFVGAALTLLRPKSANVGPGPLAVGLSFGAATFALGSGGLGLI
jgi:hypothetical protein